MTFNDNKTNRYDYNDDDVDDVDDKGCHLSSICIAGAEEDVFQAILTTNNQHDPHH